MESVATRAFATRWHSWDRLRPAECASFRTEAGCNRPQKGSGEHVTHAFSHLEDWQLACELVEERSGREVLPAEEVLPSVAVQSYLKC